MHASALGRPPCTISHSSNHAKFGKTAQSTLTPASYQVATTILSLAVEAGLISRSRLGFTSGVQDGELRGHRAQKTASVPWPWWQIWRPVTAICVVPMDGLRLPMHLALIYLAMGSLESKTYRYLKPDFLFVLFFLWAIVIFVVLLPVLDPRTPTLGTF